MSTKTKQRITTLLGWLFVVCGVAGLVLPFLQGFLFIMVGILLLSGTSSWATTLERRLAERYPDTVGKALRTVERIKRRWGLLP